MLTSFLLFLFSCGREVRVGRKKKKSGPNVVQVRLRLTQDSRVNWLRAMRIEDERCLSTYIRKVAQGEVDRKEREYEGHVFDVGYPVSFGRHKEF